MKAMMINKKHTALSSRTSFFFVTLSLLFLLGCKKEEPPIPVENENWILIDAKLYLKRWGDYPTYEFDLFQEGQNYNCLDLDGNDILLDQIYKDSTKFRFTGRNGTFYLNDTIPYETQYTRAGGVGPTVIRVFPTEDGSARIFMFECLKTNYMKLISSQREQALTVNKITDNYTYYSKLIFKREGTDTPYEMCEDLTKAIYAGVIPAGVQKSNALAKQKWLLYKYKRAGFSTYINVSDTISFKNNNTYTNNSSPQLERYGLYDMGNYYSFSIGHTTMGSGMTCSNIPKLQLLNGDIQQASFKDNTIGNGGYMYDVFLKRIK